MSTGLSKTETGLTIGSIYTRYVWSYNGCGHSAATVLTASTSSTEWACGNPIIINHVAGTVAPVNKTVTYATVTNIPGETSKCWITSNLGADHQATSVDDATEASAGWYWQFNRMQGYKHDGTNRTPNISWLWVEENSNWIISNDPCALELGSGWRIPTQTEWLNADDAGGWLSNYYTWNSPLKIHNAGHLYYQSGTLTRRGEYGYYWSSTQNTDYGGRHLEFNSTGCNVPANHKAHGFSARCIRD